MEYQKNLKFDELRAGTLVKNVPIDHPVFDEHAHYIRRRRHYPKWIKRVGDILTNFDEKKNKSPHLYCLNCGRLEDGAHRYDIGKNYLNQKTRDIKTISICVKGIKGDLLHMFRMRMKKAGCKPKDFDWLDANHNTKWNHIGDIDFKDKTLLDVGGQVGLNALMAIRKGAKEATTIEIRNDVLRVGKKLAYLLKLKNTKFINADILDYKIEKQYDIVTCFGLLHYFDIKNYKLLLKRLLGATKDTLIIEIRLEDVPGNDPIVKKQTIATPGWIAKLAKRNGVPILGSIKRDKNRYIIIFKKSNLKEMTLSEDKHNGW